MLATSRWILSTMAADVPAGATSGAQGGLLSGPGRCRAPARPRPSGRRGGGRVGVLGSARDRPARGGLVYWEGGEYGRAGTSDRLNRVLPRKKPPVPASTA